MNNYIKQYFSNLNTMVDKNPLIGLLFMISVVGSFIVLIYNAGKELGDMLYWMSH